MKQLSRHNRAYFRRHNNSNKLPLCICIYYLPFFPMLSLLGPSYPFSLLLIYFLQQIMSIFIHICSLICAENLRMLQSLSTLIEAAKQRKYILKTIWWFSAPYLEFTNILQHIIHNSNAFCKRFLLYHFAMSILMEVRNSTHLDQVHRSFFALIALIYTLLSSF